MRVLCLCGHLVERRDCCRDAQCCHALQVKRNPDAHRGMRCVQMTSEPLRCCIDREGHHSQCLPLTLIWREDVILFMLCR